MSIEDYCNEVDKQVKDIDPTVPKAPISSSAAWYDYTTPWPWNFDAWWSPTVVVHLNKLWCVWSVGHTLVYSHMQDDETWADPRVVGSDYVEGETTCAASLVDLDGVLHLFFIWENTQVIHLQYNDVDDRWTRLDWPPVNDFSTYMVPGVIAFQGRIYMTFLRNNALMWAYWRPRPDAPGYGTWSEPKGTGQAAWGAAAFIILDEKLHILFTADRDNKGKTEGRTLVDLVYDPISETWPHSSTQPRESSASGVACTTTPQGGAVGFPANVTDNMHAPVLVSLFRHGSWNANESLGASTRDIPIPVVLDNILYCFWTEPNFKIRYAKRRLDDRFLATSWMSDISSSTKLENLCIPGTHDSGTCGAPANLVATQTLTVAEQLSAGIRFLDLRIALYLGKLLIVHGLYVIDWSNGGRLLADILGDVYKFLKNTPTETVIVTMMVQGNNDMDAIRQRLMDIFEANPQYWYGYKKSTSFPGSLGEARGKIVLGLRTPDLVENWGLSLAPGWDDNDPDVTIGNVDIQDYYKPSVEGSVADSIKDKWDAVNKALFRGRKGDGKWYINFTSANTVDGSTIRGHGPETYAYGNDEESGINDKLNDYFEAPGKGQVGTFPMDFPEYPNGELITNIIEANFPSQ
ncbi:hypothetical protein PHLCEN_2v12075 [Hermanssonia centrifuga]|uniref:Phosphatidylinositol-specific phospholipase C X domain-containing protein n=1 Tax=Hermanssonia centrifuga TaxID=98765 RepID=A0A2R6NI27_9APHY|nr:hypothetical protein PHLCEN_2v12075 [Hermanssonia centrifuga]